MPVVNIKQLHDDTSSVIREVAKGKSFEVEKHGKIVATIRPVQSAELPSWSEILAPVRAL
jgi:antitoxin (DNA-binding transcriptional repressor) of toxin-antitoxin stability system